MNKATSQRNFEAWLESIRNYFDHSLTRLTLTVLLTPILQCAQRGEQEQQLLGD